MSRQLQGGGVVREAVAKRFRGDGAGVGPLRWTLTAKTGGTAGRAGLKHISKIKRPVEHRRAVGLAY